MRFRTRVRTSWLELSAALMTAGACTVGPNYKRPPTIAPDEFRGRAPGTVVDARSFADESWTTVFEDEVLRS